MRAPLSLQVVPSPASAPAAASARSPAALRSLPLPLAPAPQPHELWLAVCWPRLPLEALAAASSGSCLAVVELQQGAQYLVALDAQAERAGARVGMSWAAASALVPQLSARWREPHAEQRHLAQLAEAAQRYSPRVSLMPPDALLIEVRGSLRLFGGAAQLLRRFKADYLSAGTQPRLALAPTPLAALAGVRGARTFCVLEPARLIGALAPLPLAALGWPLESLERLAKMGVRSIGEVLRLPRAGFARRFGVELLTSLDQLTGRRADPRRSFRPSERFCARRDFSYEVVEHERILAALEPLLGKLFARLKALQCGIVELDCRLRHAHAPPTRCVLKLTTPTADPQQLRALLKERLATLSLPEPARSAEILCGELLPQHSSSHELWQPGEQGGGAGAPCTDLIERLRARLGFEAVHGLAIHSTHRPEAATRREPTIAPVRATKQRPAAAAESLRWAAHRPLWLLPEPEPLTEAPSGLPCRHGPLELLGDPERIETGWWEGTALARDYYRALDRRGVQLWVYRQRVAPHRWFLHGIYG